MRNSMIRVLGAGVLACALAAGSVPAMAEGVTESVTESTVSAETAAEGLSEGLAVVSTPRLGPGADNEDVPVYSFNETAAYVLVDSEGKIVDLEVDVLEVITPNHDNSNEADNVLAGWPGQSYNNDEDGDGTVDGQLEEDEDYFTSETASWKTKRQLGDSYQLASATWSEEMDIYENFFKGKTVDEIQDWFTTCCSDVNGRPLTENSSEDGDAEKFAALSDEDKAMNDAVSGATMSVSDAHGDIIGAIAQAVENAQPVESASEITKLGLGINVTPRLGPGTDDQDVPCYSINVTFSGTCYDADDRIAAMTTDVLEIITPNHDGADDNSFTGWPGQSYNNDEDGDGTVDGVLEQDEDTFQEQVSAFQTKRALKDKYQLASATWSEEMDAYESVMIGKTVDEVSEWFETSFSDNNGRALHGTSDDEGDTAKYDAMTDEEKAVMDTISTATMSLSDAHGDIIGAIQQSFENAKTVE